METQALQLAWPNDPTTTLSTDELVSSFFSNKSERTLCAYRQDLADFSTFLGVATVQDAARHLLGSGLGEANRLALAYRQHLQDRKLQATTINRRLAALRSLTGMARTLGMVAWRLEIRNQKTEPYRDTAGPGVVAFREMLHRTAERNDPKGARDTAILRLLFDLGLRRGEVIALQVTDLDLERGTLDILGKGRTQKTRLTLPEPTRAALAAWLDVRGTNAGPLFTSMDRKAHGALQPIRGRSLHKLVAGLGKRVGITTRPHAIRHTAVTEAVKRAQAAGYGLEEVLDFSRHANVSTLMTYRDRERNVQGALANLVSQAV